MATNEHRKCLERAQEELAAVRKRTAINQFAEAELGALVVNGRGSAKTSLPLTDTRKTRLKAEKDQERKRAAAARKVQTEQRAARNVADSVIVDGQP